MAVIARDTTVILNEDGSGELRFAACSPFATPLSFDTAPEEVTALNGLDLAVWVSAVTLAGRMVATMMGAGRISFVAPEQFRAAVAAYNQSLRKAGAGSLPVADDEDRPGGPEPGDVYRHRKPGRGLFTVVARSVKHDTREQLVTYRSCQNGTYWTRTLADFCGTAEAPDGATVRRFTRIED